MNSLLFGAAILAFGVIIFWYVKNEMAENKSGTSGFLAIKGENSERPSSDHTDSSM